MTAQPEAQAQPGWAIVIGLAAAAVGLSLHWTGRRLDGFGQRQRVLLTPVAGLIVGGLAIAYAEGSGKSYDDVLFSGQAALPHLLTQGATYTVGALLLVLVCKGPAYGVSLGSFRGGPLFPAMFIGAAGGMALSHLPGLTSVAGAAMGIGAMAAVMLTLPFTAVLLASLLVSSDALNVLPLVIVAVVVARVTAVRFTPAPAPAAASADAGQADQPAGSGKHARAGEDGQAGPQIPAGTGPSS